MKTLVRFRGPGFVLVPCNIMPMEQGVHDMDFMPVAVPEGKVLEVIVRDVQPQDNPERN